MITAHGTGRPRRDVGLLFKTQLIKPVPGNLLADKPQVSWFIMCQATTMAKTNQVLCSGGNCMDRKLWALKKSGGRGIAASRRPLRWRYHAVRRHKALTQESRWRGPEDSLLNRHRKALHGKCRLNAITCNRRNYVISTRRSCCAVATSCFRTASISLTRIQNAS